MHHNNKKDFRRDFLQIIDCFEANHKFRSHPAKTFSRFHSSLNCKKVFLSFFFFSLWRRLIILTSFLMNKLNLSSKKIFPTTTIDVVSKLLVEMDNVINNNKWTHLGNLKYSWGWLWHIAKVASTGLFCLGGSQGSLFWEYFFHRFSVWKVNFSRVQQLFNRIIWDTLNFTRVTYT